MNFSSKTGARYDEPDVDGSDDDAKPRRGRSGERG